MKKYASDDLSHKKVDEYVARMHEREQFNTLRRAERQRLEKLEAEARRSTSDKTIGRTSKLYESSREIRIDLMTREQAVMDSFRTSVAHSKYTSMKLPVEYVFTTLPVHDIKFIKKELLGHKGYTYQDIVITRPGQIDQNLTLQDLENMNPYDLEDLLRIAKEKGAESSIHEVALKTLQTKVWRFVKKDAYLENELTGATNRLKRTEAIRGMQNVADGTVRGYNLGTPEEWYEIYYVLKDKKRYFRTDEIGRISDRQIQLFIQYLEAKGRPEDHRDSCIFHLQLYLKGREYMRKAWAITGAPPAESR